jgi:hypothetical protein
VEPITSDILMTFLQRLGERSSNTATLYLLGGSALCLLGNPRSTVDVDYDLAAPQGADDELRTLIDRLAAEMKLDLEQVALREFVPIAPGADGRRKLVGRFGRIDVYIYDPYSIALSKIARGFETDIDDVMFLLQERLIEFSELERLFQAILPDARKADIVPGEFQAYFDEVKRRWVPR